MRSFLESHLCRHGIHFTGPTAAGLVHTLLPSCLLMVHQLEERWVASQW